MTSTGRHQVIRDIAALAQTLQPAPDVDTELDELTAGAVKFVPGARYAGITLVSSTHQVQTPSATGPYPTLLDEIQQRHGEGPCLSAAWEQHTILIADMAGETRWPKYCRDVVAESPIESVMSFQLFTTRQSMGALNFYAESPHVFDADAVELGLVAATHAAVGWKLVRRDEQFRSALASRDIIAQAKGMIMERFSIDATQAFELLKRLSQGTNTPLAAVARRLVESQ